MRTLLLVLIIVALGVASGAAANPNALPALAYASDGGGGSLDVYVLPSGAAEPRRLTTTTLDEFSPSWSPGGRSVAYRVNPRRSDVGDIWVMRADGRGKRNLTRSPRVAEWSPSWSPDGRRIAYYSSLGMDVWVMRRGRHASAQPHEARGAGRVPVVVARRSQAGVRIASRRPVRDLRDACRRVATGQPHPECR